MDQHWEMLGVWASVIATFFSGLATLGAVIFALTLQKSSERRQRPVLQVEYDPHSPDDNRYLAPSATDAGSPGPNREEVWIRIRVTNQSAYPAQNVELRFISSQLANDHVRNNRPSWWFKVSNLDSVSVTVPPRFTQFFDIAYLIRETQTGVTKSFIVITRPEMLGWNEEKARIESSGAYTALKIGWKYKLFFAVVGNNCDAKYYWMTVHMSPPSEKQSNILDCIAVEPPIEISSTLAFSGSPG